MGILKDLKWKKKNATIKVCPQCKEPKLQKTSFGSFTNTEYYKCINCGYEGPLFLEVDKYFDDADNKILEKLKKEFPNDIDTENTNGN